MNNANNGRLMGLDSRYKESYRYRGLPCSIRPDNELWYVAGTDHDPEKGGSGVLEWCYDQDDAERRLAIMQQYAQFSNLMVGPFIREFRYGKGQMLRTKKGWLVGTVTDTHRGKYGLRYCLRVRSKMDSKTFNQVWLFEDELSDCTPDGYVLLPTDVPTAGEYYGINARQDMHALGYRD